MKKLLTAACLALTFSAPALATDVDHFEAKESKTLKEAVANFSEYNSKLEKVLEGELTPVAMNEIHELTYTIENALAKINEEFDELALTLEEIHLSSERMETDKVREYGEQYLDTSRKVIE
jgi:hypothetical protein